MFAWAEMYYNANNLQVNMDNQDNPKPHKLPRVWHRPWSMTIETVRKMPDVRELSPETEMIGNMKGNRQKGFMLIYEILQQVTDDVTVEAVKAILEPLDTATMTDFFAIEVTGPNR